jgi:CRP/FNR family transcriptional regulator, cyclic AMP receptor protein
MPPLFYVLAQLNDMDIDWLRATGRRREVPIAGVLIEQGRPIESVFIVLEGRLSVYGAAGSGDIGIGEMLGEISFVDARPPSADVVANEDSVVLAIPKRELQAKLDADPGFAARLYRAIALLLSHRLRDAAIAASGPPVGQAPADPAATETEQKGRAERFEATLRRLKA